VSVLLELPCTSEPEWRTRVRADAAAGLPQDLECAHCGARHPLHRESLTASGGLRACVACGHPELYTQKDFPRALGIAIVVLAAVLAPFTHYLSLGAAALLDWVLYRLGPDAVVCYVCRAAHHGFDPSPKHPRFDREIEERLKYGEAAVMGKPMREGGTAGAPEPEH